MLPSFNDHNLATAKRDNVSRSGVDKPRILNLGLKPYRTVWELQRELQRNLMDHKGKDTILLCQHHAVITVGRSAKEGNVLASPAVLAQRGIELLHIERGGDVTYHGPGQLVVYPILDLRKRRQDVGWYMRLLEEVIIRTLLDFDLHGSRIPQKSGVFVGESKIASIGVRISRWCTMHGLAINVLDQSAGFSLINPCGYQGLKTCSMESLGKGADLAGVASCLEWHMLDLI